MLSMIPETEIAYNPIGSRKIDAVTCRRFGYGSATYRGKPVQVAQWRDASGEVCAQKLRFADKSFVILGDKAQMGLFGLDRVKEGGRRIIVTEGELDALAVSQVLGGTWPVVSLPNGASRARAALQRDLAHLSKFDAVVLCFDQDAAGRKAVEECLDLFAPGKLHVTKLPRKDACDMLVAGEQDMLRSLVWDSPRHCPEGIVSGDEILERIRERKSTPGVPYPWPKIDNKLRGIQPKQIVLLAAGTGCGKSTICRELAAYLLSQGETVGYIALEESVDEAALGVYGVLVNQRLMLMDTLPMKEIEAVHARFKDSIHFYDHFGSTDSAGLVGMIRYLVLGLGCTRVFLDHISIVVSGQELDNERRAIDELMTGLRAMVEQTEATLFVVSHVKRLGGGQSHEEGSRIRLADLRGSGSLGQLSDVVIGVNRDQSAEEEAERNTITLCSLKSRRTGRLGDADALIFDDTTGRLNQAPETSHAEDFS